MRTLKASICKQAPRVDHLFGKTGVQVWTMFNARMSLGILQIHRDGEVSLGRRLLVKIRRPFTYRLHDALYDAEFKLGYFGYFCALELIGTVKPEVCPPINGRMGKALRFLGFDVRAE
jgi:hypothetical protein